MTQPQLKRVTKTHDRHLFARCGVAASKWHNYAYTRFLKSEQAEIQRGCEVFAREGFFAAWVLLERGQCIGRIAAMINPAIQVDGQAPGLIGFFECQWASQAEVLIRAAQECLVTQGCRQIWAPVNYSVWHGYRFKLDHFNALYTGDIEHPAFYLDAFQRRGFAVAERYEGQTFQPDASNQLRNRLAPHKAILAASTYEVQSLKQVPFSSVLGDAWEAINRNYRQFPLFTPIAKDTFVQLYRDKAALFDLDCSVRIRDGERTVGAALVLKDCRNALLAMRGSTGWLAKLRFFLNRGPTHMVAVAHFAVHYADARRAYVDAKRQGCPGLSLPKAGLGIVLERIQRKYPNCPMHFSLVRSESPVRHYATDIPTTLNHYALLRWVNKT